MHQSSTLHANLVAPHEATLWAGTRIAARRACVQSSTADLLVKAFNCALPITMRSNVLLVRVAVKLDAIAITTVSERDKLGLWAPGRPSPENVGKLHNWTHQLDTWYSLVSFLTRAVVTISRGHWGHGEEMEGTFEGFLDCANEQRSCKTEQTVAESCRSVTAFNVAT